MKMEKERSCAMWMRLGGGLSMWKCDSFFNSFFFVTHDE